MSEPIEDESAAVLTSDMRAPPSPETGEGAPKGRMRASSRATSAFLTARARNLRRDDTDAEQKLWSELRDRRLNGHRFVRQFVVKPYIVDFACRSRRLIVELDGGQHSECSYDERRTDVLNAAGWSVLRFWNEEVLREREAVIETILAVLEGRIREACDGAGIPNGLRFAPGKPSPVRAARAARPPSPDSGEGVAPLSADAAEAFFPEARP